MLISLPSLRFFGDHTSNLSVFGCKYRYLPDKPHLRRLIRGSICGELMCAEGESNFLLFINFTDQFFVFFSESQLNHLKFANAGRQYGSSSATH